MIWRSWGFDPSQTVDPSEIPKSQLYLSVRGPLILVDIRSVSLGPASPGGAVPPRSISVIALLDTGATTTVVSPEIIQAITPHQTGFTQVHTASQTKDFPTYIGQIVFPWGSAKISEIIELDLPQTLHRCLIGRDLMKNWTMIYDGIFGQLTICDSGR